MRSIEVQPPITRQFVYFRTQHPLALRSVETTLAKSFYDVKPFSQSMSAVNSQHSWLLIIDSYSVEEWLELANECRFKRGRSIVLISKFSQTLEEELRLIYLGVHGIVAATDIDDELPRAVQCVLGGGLWLSRSAITEYVKRSQSAQEVDRVGSLTVREQQIIAFLTKGSSNKEISSYLRISERTVKFHVSNILEKFNVHSRKKLSKIGEKRTQGKLLRRAG